MPLLVVAEQGREWGWGSGKVLGLIALGVIGIVSFIIIENRMKDEALIPMRLFKNRVFSIGLGVNVLIGLGMFGALSSLPLYLQLVKGASPTAAGLMLIPMMIGIMGGSVISGQLTARTGRYKIFPVVGAAILVVTFFLLLTVTVDTPTLLLDVYFLLIGLGLGLNMQTMLIAVQNVVPAQDMGVATSSATFFRQMGGTLGVAVFLSLLFNSLPDKIGEAVQTAVGRPDFREALAAQGILTPQASQQYIAGLGSQMQTDSSFLQRVDPAIARPFQEGFVSSTHLVYIVAGIIMVLAFLLVLMMKEVPLRTMSALEERQIEAAAMAAASELPVDEQAGEILAEASDGARHASGQDSSAGTGKDGQGRHEA